MVAEAFAAARRRFMARLGDSWRGWAIHGAARRFMAQRKRIVVALCCRVASRRASLARHALVAAAPDLQQLRNGRRRRDSLHVSRPTSDQRAAAPDWRSPPTAARRRARACKLVHGRRRCPRACTPVPDAGGSGGSGKRAGREAARADDPPAPPRWKLSPRRRRWQVSGVTELAGRFAQLSIPFGGWRPSRHVRCR